MPVDTSVITGTVAHKHSSPSSDGGFLDDNVTGVTGTSTGSLVYFDGSSVAQNLGIGSASDVLTVSGGLPQWAAAGGGGGGNYTHLASGTASGGTSLSVSFSAVSPPDYVVAVWNGTVTTGQGIDKVRVNGITSSTYEIDGQYIDGGSASVVSVSDSGWYGCLSSIAGDHFICNMEFHTNAEEETIYTFIKSTSNKPGSWYGYGHNTTTGQTSLSQIDLYAGSAITGTLNVWKVTT